MSKFEDFRSDPEIRDIMERYVKKFPGVFEGFDLDEVGFIVTQKKKTPSSEALKLRTVAYPLSVFANKTYIVESLECMWVEMNPKQKNLAVFHIMCAIPLGGFDAASSNYGKKVKPEIVMYRLEYSAAGGVANWMEDDSAKDPMTVKPEDVVIPETDEDDDPIPNMTKQPVTASDILDDSVAS